MLSSHGGFLTIAIFVSSWRSNQIKLTYYDETKKASRLTDSQSYRKPSWDMVGPATDKHQASTNQTIQALRYVVHYLVSFLILQSSWRRRESCLLFFSDLSCGCLVTVNVLFLMMLWVQWSAVYDCGISQSFMPDYQSDSTWTSRRKFG